MSTGPLKRAFAGESRVLLLLLVVLTLGAFCRLDGLNRQSFEADELYTIPASLGNQYRFQSDFRQPSHPIPSSCTKTC